jgi:hypothetical protein
MAAVLILLSAGYNMAMRIMAMSGRAWDRAAVFAGEIR